VFRRPVLPISEIPLNSANLSARLHSGWFGIKRFFFVQFQRGVVVLCVPLLAGLWRHGLVRPGLLWLLLFVSF
jgi:hypothetical protein